MSGKPPFETVVATHGARVLRVCRAMLGPTDADDAWSETFLSAMKAYPQLPATANASRSSGHGVSRSSLVHQSRAIGSSCGKRARFNAMTSATRPSRRAKAAPRQKCVPWPKVRCWPILRWISNWSRPDDDGRHGWRTR
jgi:DNA-directed RNA polymerase specialized sigma24 family protein